MRQRLTIALTLALAATLAATPAALANEDGNATVAGRGKLVARGTGLVELDGGGSVFLSMRGDATIIDHAGDMRFGIRGGNGTDEQPEPEERSTTITLDDFRGVIHVWGSDFSIVAEGRIRWLKAVGHGTATLTGRGVYRTTSNPGTGPWTRGLWAGDGVTFDFAPV